MGEGELNFVCFDPLAYSNAQKNILNTTQEFVLTNEGSVEAFPLFRFVPAANVTLIKIKNLTTGKTFLYNTSWFASTPFMVDMNINRVYQEITEVNYMTDVSLDSDFWSLAIGANTIRVETNIDGTASISSIRAYWTDRFY
jgi:phage-related protein